MPSRARRQKPRATAATPKRKAASGEDCMNPWDKYFGTVKVPANRPAATNENVRRLMRGLDVSAARKPKPPVNRPPAVRFKTYTVARAAAQFERLLADVAAGCVVEITRRGQAVASVLSPARLETLEIMANPEAMRAIHRAQSGQMKFRPVPGALRASGAGAKRKKRRLPQFTFPGQGVIASEDVAEALADEEFLEKTMASAPKHEPRQAFFNDVAKLQRQLRRKRKVPDFAANAAKHVYTVKTGNQVLKTLRKAL